jgi:hypothetical protein
MSLTTVSGIGGRTDLYCIIKTKSIELGIDMINDT